MSGCSLSWSTTIWSAVCCNSFISPVLALTSLLNFTQIIIKKLVTITVSLPCNPLQWIICLPVSLPTTNHLHKPTVVIIFIKVITTAHLKSDDLQLQIFATVLPLLLLLHVLGIHSDTSINKIPNHTDYINLYFTYDILKHTSISIVINWPWWNLWKY